MGSERRGRAVHGRLAVNPSGEEPTDRPRQKNAGLREPYDGRLSRTVLREREGEVPSRHSPGIFTGNCPCGFGLVVLGRAARVRCVPAQQGEQSGMINPKSRRHSEKRLPSMSLEPRADLPPLPPPDELITRTTKTLVWNADPDLEVYVVDRRTLNSQERLVDFALVVTARHGPDEEWREVIKIDTAHRTVHVHQSGLRDTASVPPDCRVNVDRAHAWAHAYAWDTATTLMEVPDG